MESGKRKAESGNPVRISLLGSTGSIGTQVLDVVRRLGPKMVDIVGLGAQNNADLLIKQALEFDPMIVCIGDESCRLVVSERLAGKGIRVVAGPSGFDELAIESEADKIVVSVAGTPGLSPTLRAIEAGKDVALASKEVLVAAGHLVMDAVKRAGVALLPIDSEHSAIFQCLNGEDRESIEKIYLTASGGAFRNTPKSELANVTAEQALAHPTWKMGRKVTVDSATMMNKGLEIIEAKWFFGVEADQIEVVIHPTSIVHSMVRFCDGSIIAQLGLPDMRLPIQYSLLYPKRVDSKLPRLDILEAGALAFEKVDFDKFECLALAMEAARVGGTLAVVMNAADEVAVDMFLKGRLGFLDIPRVVQQTMESHTPQPSPSLEEIYAVDAEARRKALEFAEFAIRS
ncbi:MAG: 1-deoxy-D-xylulose-5-phosphate reductoisomerase [Armatimonadetes bacterium]|nr:1-deoxy-D-xylulose-5-phosphate reductoisomerase [Armatimonadota bacterium]